MDKGWEWQARRSLASDSAGGEVLFDRKVRCDSVEWQRWTAESNSFSSSVQLDSLQGLASDGQLASDLEASRNLCLGAIKGDFNPTYFTDGDEEICWSNVLRYNERRYCSKCTTSSSNTAISWIRSDAGWRNKTSLSNQTGRNSGISKIYVNIDTRNKFLIRMWYG